MSTTNSVTRKTADWVQREDTEGARYDSGPYIGIVKENRDPLMTGRLQIWIPEFGGIETDPKYWRTVNYASPFLGATYQDPFAQESPRPGATDKNSFRTVRHTYGMWYNVPDLENWVLCTFVGGDAARGYWFACVPNQLGHYMVPGIGSTDKLAAVEDPSLQKIVEPGQPYPVVEFNEYDKSVNWSDLDLNKKPVHETQLKVLVEQGLDRKRLTGTRGIITSTSQRETPAGVFGVSTPGRPVGAYPEQNAPSIQRRIKTRKGGHTFVMDDGDKDGNNNLTRWRSAGGHQILMDDSENILYIINANGSTYIEMGKAGHLNVYSSNSINFRTKAELNFHADGNMNINVGGSFNLNVKGQMNLQAATITAKGVSAVTLYGGSLKLGSDGRLDLYTSGGGSFTASQSLMMTGGTIGLNSGAGPSVSKPRDIPLKSLADTQKSGTGQWVVVEGKIKSVATIVPTHEPWNRKSGSASSESNAVQDTENDDTNLEDTESPDSTTSSEAEGDDNSTITDDQGINLTADGATEVAGDRDPGIESAASETISKNDVISETDMLAENAPTVTESVGPLSSGEVKALAVQTGKTLSDNNPLQVASNGALGAYAATATNLASTGHVALSALDQYSKNPAAALQDAASWTGKDGINRASEFLSNKTVQDSVFVQTIQKNYKDGVVSGCFKLDDTKSAVAGMLSAGYTLGNDIAKAARLTGNNPIDSYGNSFNKLYNLGASAVKRRPIST